MRGPILTHRVTSRCEQLEAAAGVEPGGGAADVGAADVGPWPTLASDISIARGDVSLKTSPMGYGWEYHLLGKWMAEPIVDGAKEEEATS